MARRLKVQMVLLKKTSNSKMLMKRKPKVAAEEVENSENSENKRVRDAKDVRDVKDVNHVEEQSADNSATLTE
jgi:hypothetical protein